MLKRSHLLILPSVIVCLFPQGWGYGPFNHLCVVNRHWQNILQQVSQVGPIADTRVRDAVFAGAMADDLGYYPKLHQFENLTDMTHYVRTGGWVKYVLAQSLDINLPPDRRALLYAFALGVLSHYAVDRFGHYFGTNVVAADIGDKQGLYGGHMTYERNPQLHKAVETGFDTMSMVGSCREEIATRRMQEFSASKDREDVAIIARFMIATFAGFYNVDLGVDTATLVNALVEARLMLGKELFDGEYLYGKAVKGRNGAPHQTPTSVSAPPIILVDLEVAKAVAGTLTFTRSTVQASDYYSTFKPSFEKADQLFADLLLEAAPKAIAGRNSSANPGQTGPRFLANINLDTNSLSASGRYVLADRRYEDVAAGGGKATCPPTQGPLSGYFRTGAHTQEVMNAQASSDDHDLHDQLVEVGKLVSREFKVTGTDFDRPLDLGNVNFHRVSLAAGHCPSGSGAVAFGTAGSICVAANNVYWNESSHPRAASLWFAGLAAADLSTAKGVTKRKQAVRAAERLRRENVEAFRLCDAANHPIHYFPSDFCSNYSGNAPAIPPDPPKTACVEGD